MNAQKTPAFISSQLSDIREVKVSIRFGNPNYSDCRNFGICKMNTPPQSDASSASKLHHANAMLQKKGKNIWLSFIKASMHPKTEELYFGRGVFEIGAEKNLSKEILHLLEITDFLILIKKYNIINTEGYFTIELTG